MRHVVHDVSDVLTWAAWAGIALLWALGAWQGRHRPEGHGQGSHDGASRVALILAMAVAITPGSLWRWLALDTTGLRLLGALLLLAACLFTMLARASLGPMWSSAATVKRHHMLRTDGVYGITRHPIYTGILAMLVGTALTQGLGRWVAILTAVVPALMIKMRAEERLLASEFPGEYERYRRGVPALVPLPVRRGCGHE